MCRWYSPGMLTRAYGALASNCRSLGVQLACEAGASVPCTQPPSAQAAKPRRTNPNPFRMNPDLTKADESVLAPDARSNRPVSNRLDLWPNHSRLCGIWAREAALG